MRTFRDGLILGRSLRASPPVGFHTARAPEPEGDLITYSGGDGHLMTIGSSGCGKTTGPVITNALAHPGAAVIIDIKGEVYRATASARRRLGPVHVIDLRDDYQVEGSLNSLDLAAMGGSDIDVLSRHPCSRPGMAYRPGERPVLERLG